MKRAAMVLLVLNGAVAGFSLAGTATRPLWPWLDWDFARLAMVLGIVNILTGFAVALLHMAATQGWRRVWPLLVLCLLVGGGAELLGTTTGFPFGQYEYTGQLGPRFLGHVPYVIAVAWFMMFYPSLHIAVVLRVPRWAIGLTAAAVLTLWDVVLEAAMTGGFACWEWQQEGLLYGIPLQNWLGWYVTGWLIGTVYSLGISEWRETGSMLPVALYAVQSVFAGALAVLYGRELAAVIWAAGFFGLMALVYRRRSIAVERSPASSA